MSTAATPAFAAGITSVKAPRRVKAGASAKVVVSVSAVTRCRLGVGTVSALAQAAGADRVTFTFLVSPKARPGRYTLVLSCGSTPRRLRMTVIPRTGKPGTAKRIVSGRIKVETRKPFVPAPRPSPAPTPVPVPAPAPVPTATPTPTPVVPGPQNSFRAVYALASDQTETPGYVAGIAATIDAVDGWFATQTFGGVMPRWIPTRAARRR